MIFGWKYAKLTEKTITTAATSNNSFASKFTCIHYFKIAVKF